MNARPRLRTALWRLARGKAQREDGQALIIAVLALVVLLAMAGFAIDVGRVYVAQRQLQAAVDAAALAASQELPNPTFAQTTANNYSAMVGASNEAVGFSANPPDVKVYCLVTIPNSAQATNVPCQNYPNGSTTSGWSCTGSGNNPDGTANKGCNAISVSETAKVDTTFLNVIGLGSLFTGVKSTSTVLMRGGTPHPLDVMIVLDVSSSMNQNCTNAGGAAYHVAGMPVATSSKLDCAKEGIRTLIDTLWPCDPSFATCPSPNSNPLDEVGLEAFPGVTSGVFGPDFDCSWTLTTADMGYSNTSGYDMVPPSSDFRVSDANTSPNADATLNPASQLVQAVSWSSCPGANWPQTAGPSDPLPTTGGTPGASSKYGAEAPACGGPCTFFTDAIGNAALKIFADTQPPPNGRGAKGVLIILSDGDANTQGPNACKSAVDTANQVAVAPFNFWVFSIGYDIPNSGCSTDTAGAHSEVEQIAVSATAGQFNVTYKGVTTTSPVAFNASAAAMTTALNTIPALAGNVTVTGGGGAGTNHTWNVTFSGTLANTQISPSPGLSGATAAAPNQLTGGTSTVTVTTTTYGTASGSAYTPFQTMQSMASDPSKFYCLHPPGANTCNGANAANLNQIFKDIGIDITGARVVSG